MRRLHYLRGSLLLNGGFCQKKRSQQERETAENKEASVTGKIKPYLI